jgi:hypothetical protein
MGSKNRVISQTDRVKSASNVGEKLDRLADAVEQLARYLEDVEDAVKRLR